LAAQNNALQLLRPSSRGEHRRRARKQNISTTEFGSEMSWFFGKRQQNRRGFISLASRNNAMSPTVLLEGVTFTMSAKQLVHLGVGFFPLRATRWPSPHGSGLLAQIG